MQHLNVVVASPATKSSQPIQAWDKQTNYSIATIFMPWWILGELESCRRICYPTPIETTSSPLQGIANLQSVTAADLQLCYERFGGSARVAFTHGSLQNATGILNQSALESDLDTMVTQAGHQFHLLERSTS